VARSGGHRAALESLLLEERPGPADVPARRDAEDLHDRVAVQVGADGRHRLLLGDPGDPLSRSSYAAASRAALRRLRVVLSERVSRCRRSSSGPASAT
jgi:hypothetical protein